jgi:hypothetical protein
MAQIQKTSRYFLSKQERNVWAKKPSRATVPLMLSSLLVIPFLLLLTFIASGVFAYYTEL